MFLDVLAVAVLAILAIGLFVALVLWIKNDTESTFWEAFIAAIIGLVLAAVFIKVISWAANRAIAF